MWWSDPAGNSRAWYSNWNDEAYQKSDSAIATAMLVRWKRKFNFPFYPIFYLNREPDRPEFEFIEHIKNIQEL
ncbi:hypothetical protein [Nonlabens xiamenensis]|uniref:hypothetical protein n=1 Tax=Nonlabens xiamenensis TaxID=2341043 RepID=UPI000F60A3BE|nr:hypothetical protein [Nonlabens xiamenensis]